MTQTIFIILVSLIVGAAIGVAFIIFLRRQKWSNNSFVMLQNQVSEISRTIDSRLGQSHKTFESQVDRSMRLIKDVTERLTKIDEAHRQSMDFNQRFADQLRSLQDVLKNPKQRGVLGEYYLETVLKNVFPPGRFKMQYKFADGETVDAVIFLDKGKILSIDSKFSLENYNRILESSGEEREKYEKLFKQDLKNRIDETSKYIRPDEGTMDFAFMFIPSEAIYYDLLINQIGAVKTNTRDLIEYAFVERHVIIVSPTSFLAYLQTVLHGLKALQIEESAKEIRKRVEEMGKHLKHYEEFVAKLGIHLGTAVNTYNASYKELGKIDKDIYRITGHSPGLEPTSIDKPNIDE